jgi:uncharacterized membrane protein YfcA
MSLESLAGVTLLELACIWLGTAGAAVLRAFTGFGFALAAVPVFAFFLQPPEVVVLTASLAVVLGVQTLPQYAGALNVQHQWPVFLLAVPGTVLGATLLRGMEVEEFRLALGLVTVLASLVLARFHPARRQAHPGTRAGTGFVSGLLGGAFAVPGPPVIVYIMATESDPGRSRAFMIGFFSFAALMALITYASLGWVSLQTLALVLLAYPAMFAGDRVGYRLFQAYGGAHYRRIGVAACLLIGIAIILRALL